MTDERNFIAPDIPRPGKIELEITQEVIDAAVRADSSACVIADAINAQFPGANADVDLQSITFTLREKGYRYTWLTPWVGQQHLVAFDQGEEVGPFSMVLDGRGLVKARKRQPSTKTGGQTLKSVDGRTGGTKARVAAVPGTPGPVDVKVKPLPPAVLSNRKDASGATG